MPTEQQIGNPDTHKYKSGHDSATHAKYAEAAGDMGINCETIDAMIAEEATPNDVKNYKEDMEQRFLIHTKCGNCGHEGHLGIPIELLLEWLEKEGHLDAD